MELSAVSRQRSRIMGLAMLWIIYFHMTVPDDPGLIVWFSHRTGFYGVDLFLLLSGLGLWRSLSKNGSTAAFYARRALRVFPAYLTVCAVYYAKFRVSAGAFALSASTLGYWLRKEHLEWFIPTIVLFYAAAPWIYRLMKRAKRPLTVFAASVAVSALLCVFVWLVGEQDLFGTTVRIPVFVLGFLFGRLLEETPKKKYPAAGVIALFVFGFSAAYVLLRIKTDVFEAGLNAWPGLIIAPALALLAGWCFDRVECITGAGRFLLMPFDFLGRYSLEIYLLHECFPRYFAGEGQFRVLLLVLLSAPVLHEGLGLLTGLFAKLKKAR